MGIVPGSHHQRTKIVVSAALEVLDAVEDGSFEHDKRTSWWKRRRHDEEALERGGRHGICVAELVRPLADQWERMERRALEEQRWHLRATRPGFERGARHVARQRTFRAQRVGCVEHDAAATASVVHVLLLQGVARSDPGPLYADSARGRRGRRRRGGHGAIQDGVHVADHDVVAVVGGEGRCVPGNHGRRREKKYHSWSRVRVGG